MIVNRVLWLHLLSLLLALCCHTSRARIKDETFVRSSVFLSPEFVMTPGSVVNRVYYNLDFPKGHIDIKSFNAEVVDKNGVPVPLHESYLHHWLLSRYQVPNDIEEKRESDEREYEHRSDLKLIRNSGNCERFLTQYYGLGSETRKTLTWVPDPYAIEVGNQEEILEGYEERWLINVHAIDTRGVMDKLGCTECRCDLYNVTQDEDGKPLSPNYHGGLDCCYDKSQCKVKENFAPTARRLYLRYTVEWVHWEKSVLPVKIFIFDITDTWKISEESELPVEKHNCQIEYGIKPCESSTLSANDCIDTKKQSFIMPTGGYVIYGVAHQHAGGIGSSLYRKDGEVICSSMPTYGNGTEAGNEAGYIVGMSTCYPRPGSIKIHDGETLIHESNYSSSQEHTGVMGLFYILLADQLPSQRSASESLLYNVAMATLACVGVIGVAVAVRFLLKSRVGHGYSPVST